MPEMNWLWKLFLGELFLGVGCLTYAWCKYVEGVVNANDETGHGRDADLDDELFRGGVSRRPADRQIDAVPALKGNDDFKTDRQTVVDFYLYRSMRIARARACGERLHGREVK
jgi:hypothetical protein